MVFVNFKPLEESNQEIIQCIAENSELYVLKTYRHCVQQKVIGQHIQNFTLIDCLDNKQQCNNANIKIVPTWLIKGEKHKGVFQLEELTSLTGCWVSFFSQKIFLAFYHLYFCRHHAYQNPAFYLHPISRL